MRIKQTIQPRGRSSRSAPFIRVSGFLIGCCLLWGCQEKADEGEAAPELQSNHPRSTPARRSAAPALRAGASPKVLDSIWNKELSEDELREQLFKLAEEDPAEALRRLQKILVATGRGSDLLRDLIDTYWRHDPDRLLAEIQSNPDANFQQRVFGVLFENSHDVGSTDSWLSWIDRFGKSGEVGSVTQVAALLAITEHLDGLEQSAGFPKLFDRFSDAVLPLLKDPACGPLLHDFGILSARYHPEKLPELVRQFPAGTMASLTVEKAIEESARLQPELAAQWLSSPEVYMDLFFVEATMASEIQAAIRSEDPVESEAARQAMNEFIASGYDKALKSYAYGIVDSDPQAALETAELIQGPELRAKILEQLKGRAKWLESQTDGHPDSE